MLDQFNNELGGNDESWSENARRVMSSVFGLNGARPLPDEDEDDTADDRLQEFCRLYDAIEALPDADKRLAQAKTVLELLAGGTDGVVDFVVAGDYDEADVAARKIAEAIATIEENRETYIPARIYNPIGEAITEWLVNDEDWLTTPRMIRAGLPGILREVFCEDE
jgi:hypothetical protein